MVFSFCQKENQFFVAHIEIGVCVFFFCCENVIIHEMVI